MKRLAPEDGGGRGPRRERPGMALLLVLLAIALATLTLAGLQSYSYRQASAGRETVARLRARWAARAGIEETIARFEYLLLNQGAASTRDLADELAEAAEGTLGGGAASWRIRHDDGTQENPGPADAHAKLNINLMTRADLLTLDGMTEDVADSILDWIDADDEPRPLGAEAGRYSTLLSPYEPRNGWVRSLFELELVAGVESDRVRGEDWNLSGTLEPNENDGDASWPPDNGDGVLDAGWSALVTAAALEPGLTPGGQPMIFAREASADELVDRIPSLTGVQAAAIIDYARSGNTRIEELITTTLSSLASQPTDAATPADLTDAQLRALLGEVTFADPGAGPAPGRANINTISRESLDSLSSISPGLADAMLSARDGRVEGFTSLLELLEIPSMSRNRLVTLSRSLGVATNTFVMASVGRDTATGMEALIVAAISGGSAPVEIMEWRTR